MTVPGCGPHRDSRDEHIVHFYEDPDCFIEGLARHIGESLQAGNTAIVIATEPHRKHIEQHLRQAVPHMDASPFYRNQYLALDAELTLAAFMVDGWPDERRFNQTVGALVRRAAQAGFGRIVAFGEMVALLVEAGNASAAVRLEELWNGLARHYAFSLLCGYPAHLFRGDDGKAFAQICQAHDRICSAI